MEMNDEAQKETPATDDIGSESAKPSRTTMIKRMGSVLLVLVVLGGGAVWIVGQSTADGDGSETTQLQQKIDGLEASLQQQASALQKLQEGQARKQVQIDALLKSQNEIMRRVQGLGSQAQRPETEISAPLQQAVPTAVSIEQNPQPEHSPALQDLIDSFPREVMLLAVQAQEKRAAEKPSWLQKALARHIKVRDDGFIDPTTAIDNAQRAVSRSDIKTALELIRELTPPVRASAADWVKRAKKIEKSGKD